jgi:hypothetical protein
MAAISAIRVVPLWQGLIPILLYPLSIAFVAVLEKLKIIKENAACDAF